jgi:hypothetical protein
MSESNNGPKDSNEDTERIKFPLVPGGATKTEQEIADGPQEFIGQVDVLDTHGRLRKVIHSGDSEVLSEAELAVQYHDSLKLLQMLGLDNAPTPSFEDVNGAFSEDKKKLAKRIEGRLLLVPKMPFYAMRNTIMANRDNIQDAPRAVHIHPALLDARDTDREIGGYRPVIVGEKQRIVIDEGGNTRLSFRDLILNWWQDRPDGLDGLDCHTFLMCIMRNAINEEPLLKLKTDSIVLDSEFCPRDQKVALAVKISGGLQIRKVDRSVLTNWHDDYFLPVIEGKSL